MPECIRLVRQQNNKISVSFTDNIPDPSHCLFLVVRRYRCRHHGHQPEPDCDAGAGAFLIPPVAVGAVGTVDVHRHEGLQSKTQPVW